MHRDSRVSSHVKSVLVEFIHLPSCLNWDQFFVDINKFTSYNCLLNSTQDLHNFGWQIHFWKVLVQTGAAKRSRQLANQGTLQQELRPDMAYFFPVWRRKESNITNCEINLCYLGLYPELLQLKSLLEDKTLITILWVF